MIDKAGKIRYRVSSGVFRIILVSKEEKDFTVESKDKGLSLGKFS